MCERDGHSVSTKPVESDFDGTKVAGTEGGFSASEIRAIRGPVTVADVHQEVEEDKTRQPVSQRS